MWVIEMVHFLILEKSSNGNSLLSDFMPRVSVARMVYLGSDIPYNLLHSVSATKTIRTATAISETHRFLTH